MQCLKCGHEWVPKVDRPRRCPHCSTATYMFPPGVGFASGTEMRDSYDFSQGEIGKYAGRVDTANVPKKPVKTAYPVEEGEALFFLDESKEVDMDDLRKIASGEIGLDRTQSGVLSGGVENTLVGASTPRRSGPPDLVPAETIFPSQPCLYKELDQEKGEWVYCALPAHGPKVKHVPGKRESA